MGGTHGPSQKNSWKVHEEKRHPDFLFGLGDFLPLVLGNCWFTLSVTSLFQCVCRCNPY